MKPKTNGYICLVWAAQHKTTEMRGLANVGSALNDRLPILPPQEENNINNKIYSFYLHNLHEPMISLALI